MSDITVQTGKDQPAVRGGWTEDKALEAEKRAAKFVAEEIKVALYLHKLQFGNPNGLIIGQEKYRRITSSLTPTDAGNGLRQLNGLSVLVDAAQPKRLSVF